MKDEDFESDFEEAHSTKTLNVKQRLQANPDFMQKLQAKIIRSKESFFLSNGLQILITLTHEETFLDVGS